MTMRLTTVEATTLDDAWFKCLFELFDGDYETYVIDQGSYQGDTRREFDWITVRIRMPGGRPEELGRGLGRLIPTVPQGVPPPCDEEGILRYFSEYLFCDRLRPAEQYTYGSRLCQPISGKSQVQAIIDRYREHGPGNNQLVLQVARPEDILLDDPPCLRHIDTRIRHGKLHFMPYFRSWDLWGGFPLNLAGIQLLKEYMAAEIGVEDGEIIATSKGLHIYGHAEDVARLRAGRSKR